MPGFAIHIGSACTRCRSQVGRGDGGSKNRNQYTGALALDDRVLAHRLISSSAHRSEVSRPWVDRYS